MNNTKPCCVDGCDTRVSLFTQPPLCTDCRDRLRAKASAAEARERARVEPDRGRPGDLKFTPRTPQERTAHRRALRKKNYGNGRIN